MNYEVQHDKRLRKTNGGLLEIREKMECTSLPQRHGSARGRRAPWGWMGRAVGTSQGSSDLSTIAKGNNQDFPGLGTCLCHVSFLMK